MTVRRLDVETVKAQVLSMGPKGRMFTGNLKISNHSRTKDILTQLSAAISAGFNYISYTEKCSTCPFLRRCRF